MNSLFTRSTRWLAPSMLAALLVLTRLRAGACQYAAARGLRGSKRAPSVRGARASGSMLEGMHYSQSKLDDKLSAIGVRPLPRKHRQPAHQPARLGRRGFRAVQAALRRHDPQRRCRSRRSRSSRASSSAIASASSSPSRSSTRNRTGRSTNPSNSIAKKRPGPPAPPSSTISGASA